MRSEWSKVFLSDIADEVSDGLHKAPKFIENGEYLFVNATNLENGKIVEKDSGKRTTYEEFLKYGVPLNERTILYSIDGTIGNVARYQGEKCVLGKGACYIILKENVVLDYIYYLLQSPVFKEYIHTMATGSTIKHISLKTMRNFCFMLPPESIQLNTSKILRLLDDKIELNNRINQKLEEMAQAVFDELFMTFVDESPFTSVIQILGGGTPKTGNPDYWDGCIPFFTPKDVGNPYTLKTEKYISESGLNSCNSRLYPENTVFVTARGTVGKVSLSGIPMAMNQSCYALIGKDELGQFMTYHLTLKTINSLKNKANGAVFDAIVTRDFDTETIRIPIEKQSKEFQRVVTPIYERILLNSKENVNLNDLRDTLLPKLMSGELRVPAEEESCRI